MSKRRLEIELSTPVADCSDTEAGSKDGDPKAGSK